MPFVGSFLHKIALRPNILEEFMRVLLITDRSKIQILIHKDMERNKTQLDLAIDNKISKSINLLMEILHKYQNHPLYNETVD